MIEALRWYMIWGSAFGCGALLGREDVKSWGPLDATIAILFLTIFWAPILALILVNSFRRA